MKLLRNPEVKKVWNLQLVVTVLVTALAYQMEPRYGLFMFFVCLVFILIHYLSTRNRYRRITELATEIDEILHGDGRIMMESYSEGELGILQSEIYKMTVRLREQQQILQEDKIYLADSLADISHQIRTPLTSINLLVSFISEPDITSERRRKLSYDLFELLSRIDWLITALLKISKLDAGTIKFTRETYSLEEVLKTATAPILVPMDLRNQQLILKADGTFTGDLSWTCEAITNVIKNCMEHTPENGRIQVDAHENALYTEIVINDNGGGIDQEDLPHIFERFYKGKNSDEKSYGIGLALARMIIVKQNGTIKAENQTPKGAKFTIRFYKEIV